MHYPVNVDLVKAFLQVLNNDPPQGKQKETVVQDFLESNTELIPTPNLLNHHLHYNVIISKLPLDTSLVSDFVYLTKSSDTWRITFVEIEVPDKKIFTNSKDQVNTSADFNAAIGQVRSWQVFLKKNRDEVIRRLKPLMLPLSMANNPIEFQFQLIIGRSEEKNLTQARRDHFREIAESSSIDIMTYDTLIEYYKNHLRYFKNIFALKKERFIIKSLSADLRSIFSFISPEHLELSANQKQTLKDKGFQIEEWESGKPLMVNGKYTLEEFEKMMEQKPSTEGDHEEVSP